MDKRYNMDRYTMRNNKAGRWTVYDYNLVVYEYRSRKAALLSLDLLRSSVVIRFNPFPKLDGRYGAPMGRCSGKLKDGCTVDELCVSRPQGEYDSGGAYWGSGGSDGPVWAVWRRGHGKEGVVYVRARGKHAAKTKALAD
jgi:hypothetical protein